MQRPETPLDQTTGSAPPWAVVKTIGNVATGGSFQVNAPVDAFHYHSEGWEKADDRCLVALNGPADADPRSAKILIEKTEGVSMESVYRWVLETAAFKDWHRGDAGSVLWIRGDAGKGKTMLLCGIIDFMASQTKLETPDATELLAYYFCRVPSGNVNATSVLRGLIYQLVRQEPRLISYARREWDSKRETAFQSWTALSAMFEGMLKDAQLTTTYLVVDALDLLDTGGECVGDLRDFLRLIVQVSSACHRTKWLVSSRNSYGLVELLERERERMVELSLERNASHVSAAVGVYIQHRARELAAHHGSDEGDALQRRLASKAGETFLWVSFVCRALSLDAATDLKTNPPALDSLYESMVQAIRGSNMADMCDLVLEIVAAAYRPLNLRELESLFRAAGGAVAGGISSRSWIELIKRCGSILTLRDSFVYFIHPSAKTFWLRAKQAGGARGAHRMIWTASMQFLSDKLHRGMSKAELDTLWYPCVHWVDHLCDGEDGKAALGEGGLVDKFLRNSFLFWVEALSLLEEVPAGIRALERLAGLFQPQASKLSVLVRDAHRFLKHHKETIEQNSDQVYRSALLFSPPRSAIKTQFATDVPDWVTIRPAMQSGWDAESLTLRGHKSRVNSVVFSHDGSLIASASDDKTIQIWDSTTGAHQRTITGHGGKVSSVDFSHHNKTVLATSSDGSARIWDASSGSCLRTLEGSNNGAAIRSGAFSHDGRSAAFVSGGKTILLWDLNVRTLQGHSEQISAVACSNQGNLIASSSGNGSSLLIHDAATGEQLQQLKGHTDKVNSIAFSQDDRLVVTASFDDTVRIWDVATGECQQTLQGHDGTAYAAVFSPDGRWVASASNDKMTKTLASAFRWMYLLTSAPSKYSVKIWDVTTGTCQHTCVGQHESGINSVAFSCDSREVASASDDATIKICNVSAGACAQRTLNGHGSKVNTVVFSSDGRYLVSASDDRTVKIWGGTTYACLRTFKGHGAAVRSAAVSHDGRSVVSTSSGMIKIWDAGTGVTRQTIIHGSSNTDACSVIFGHDGHSIVSASDNNAVKIWSISTRTLGSHESEINGIAFSPNNRSVLSASEDNTIKILDVATGTGRHTLQGHSGGVIAARYLRSGRLIMSASQDKTVKTWDTATGVCLKTQPVFSARVSSIAISPTGSLIASASSDGIARFLNTAWEWMSAVLPLSGDPMASTVEDRAVRTWDVATGACRLKLDGHESGVNAVALSHDGRRVVSASDDRTVRIWDSGLLALEAHSAAVDSVAFSQDGRWVISSTAEKTVKIWDVATGSCHQTVGAGEALDSALEGFGNLCLEEEGTKRMALPGAQSPSPRLLSVSADGEWVMYGSERLLRLPSEYKSECAVATASDVAIGCASGRVLILSFVTGKIPGGCVRTKE
ncbi:WD40-repeat-containing domain protein [Immersiella caudata]|uniref:WD40-repeat-containing domain protein n=1 Tax=Immersiella caudata TaxID=314043 RepID=A0AA39XH01_9PEZI|nr:WD40-repeat-containing domain protein [Immersiella caudata]